jgi:hypothetical protein
VVVALMGAGVGLHEAVALRIDTAILLLAARLRTSGGAAASGVVTKPPSERRYAVEGMDELVSLFGLRR